LPVSLRSPFLNRSYSAPYGTFTGQVVLALVAALYAAGLTWLHKLGQIPVPGRFLGQPQVRLDEPEATQVSAGGGW